MLGIIWGMNVPLRVLSIIGMVLLAVLALFLAVLLLLAFFPFTYRVSGSKDAEGLKLSVKVNWLFGLFRVRFRYPEPGHLTARALWFTLFDCRIPPETGGDGSGGELEEKDFGKKLSGLLGKSKSGKDRKAQKHSSAGEGGKENGTEAGKRGAAEGDRAQDDGGRKSAEDSAAQSGSSNGAGGVGSAGALNEAGGTDSEGASEGAGGTDPADALDEAGAAGASEGTDKGTGQGSEGADASGSVGNDTLENTSDSAGSSDSGGASEASQESSGKFSQKIQKIKYTICNIYDKIKKIWKNISYYIELLQEENTKQLAAHALERGKKVFKSVGPRHVKGELVFGAGSPDTTGYLYGGYCVVASLFGIGFRVTPDFEQKRLEGEFDVSGHVILWVFAINGLKLLFDRKLRVFLRGLKAAQKKASA